MYKRRGLSLLEILIVLAVLSITAGFVAIGSRNILQGQEERAAVTSVQTLFWQGATAASSRGKTLELVRSGSVLSVREQDSGTTIRREELPNEVDLSLPDGLIATFVAPGKVSMASSDSFTIQGKEKTYVMTVSLIGEVKKEVQ